MFGSSLSTVWVRCSVNLPAASDSFRSSGDTQQQLKEEGEHRTWRWQGETIRWTLLERRKEWLWNRSELSCCRNLNQLTARWWGTLRSCRDKLFEKCSLTIHEQWRWGRRQRLSMSRRARRLWRGKRDRTVCRYRVSVRVYRSRWWRERELEIQLWLLL